MIRRGEIYYANLDPVIGSEISKTRPVLIMSNDVNNLNSSTLTVIPISSQADRIIYPFEVNLRVEESGLPKNSIIKTNQIRTIDRARFRNKIGMINSEKMIEVENALCIHLDIHYLNEDWDL